MVQEIFVTKDAIILFFYGKNDTLTLAEGKRFQRAQEPIFIDRFERVLHTYSVGRAGCVTPPRYPLYSLFDDLLRPVRRGHD